MIKKKLGIFIGRFQPFHFGHLKSLEFTLTKCEKCLVIIGGHLLSISGFNPWDTDERIEMLRLAIPNNLIKKLEFVQIMDYLYNENYWKMYVLKSVRTLCADDNEIILFGHMKDDSSYYLKMFSEWEFMETGNFFQYNSTDFRKKYFSRKKHNDLLDMIPANLHEYLKNWKKTSIYKSIQLDFFSENIIPKTEQKTYILCQQYGFLLVEKKINYPYKNLISLPEKNDFIENFLIKNSSHFKNKQNYLYNKRLPIYDPMIHIEKWAIENFQNILLPDQYTWIHESMISEFQEIFIEDHYQIIRYGN